MQGPALDRRLRFRKALRRLGRTLVDLLAIYGYAGSGHPMPSRSERDQHASWNRQGDRPR